jgi:hypothetical protein
MCNAQWGTSVKFLATCPSAPNDYGPGYIARSDETIIQGSIKTLAPTLVVLPAQDGSSTALFGIYPPFDVQPGDHFRATLSCLDGYDCGVEFALEYFDANGKYVAPDQEWSWKYHSGDAPIQLDIPIGVKLAGQTVKLTLAIRDDNNNPASDFAVWINPRIWRDPQAELVPSTDENNAPGTVSGTVNMSSAPPYLSDPGSGKVRPVAVVLFNLDDGRWWYVLTKPDGSSHDFQMTVPPGNYQAAAYALGAGGAEYVTAAYTGENPSCGKPTVTIKVEPSQDVSNIDIADWNWNCSGTASRPAKPGNVPIP